jgi:hypothetical protein
MIELFVGVIAYFVVGRLAVRKGYAGTMASEIAAVAFAAGVLLGLAGLFVDAALRPLMGWRESRLWVGAPTLPHNADLGNPMVYLPLACGGLALVVVAAYFVLAPVRSRQAPGTRRSRVPFRVLGVFSIFSALTAFFAFDGKGYSQGLGLILLGTGIYCFRLHRRTLAASAKDLVANDDRQPVLYLRAFAAEDVFGKQQQLPAIAGRPVTFDEFLTAAIRERVGPLVGLGNPEDLLPTLGAARDYVSDEQWFDVFRDWAGRARCILVLPSAGSGLNAELSYLCGNQLLQKTLVLLPPPQFGGTDERAQDVWLRFVSVLGQHGVDVGHIEPEPGQVVAFGEDGKPYLVGCRLDEPDEFVEAIERAILRSAGPPVVGQGTEFDRARADNARVERVYSRWFRVGAVVSRLLHGRSGTAVRTPSQRVVRWVAIAMFVHSVLCAFVGLGLLAISGDVVAVVALMLSSIVIAVLAFALAIFRSRAAAAAAIVGYALALLQGAPYSVLLPWWGDRTLSLWSLAALALFIASVQAFRATVQIYREGAAPSSLAVKSEQFENVVHKVS